jgi:hypothetical protein
MGGIGESMGDTDKTLCGVHVGQLGEANRLLTAIVHGLANSASVSMRGVA